jgi:outer membrane protein OmpA-like peptidoglycan-associated protein
MQMTNMKTFIVCALLHLSFSASSQDKGSFTVHFDFDSYNLTNTAKASLDSFIASTNGHLKIQLNGHCDSVGNNVYNDNLSTQRVMAVKNYLLKHSITTKSFTVAAGHGKRQPLNNNATDEERLLNRRVEIVTERKEKNLDEQIENTSTNNTLVLKNLNFVGARHQLLPESLPVLEELLAVMKKNKTLKIEIQGHICCLPGNVDGFDEETGTDNLSELRAKAVWEYLIKNGIEEARVSYTGFGHNHPIYAYPEKTELEKTLNRRVEIRILSK